MSPAEAGAMTTNIFNPEYRRAMLFCGVAVIGAVLYGYDGTYYTSILEMDKFKHDFGERQADGTYDITSTIRSVTTSIVQAGEVVGALFAGPIGDWGGRRAGILAACMLVTLGVVLQMIVAGNVPLLGVGRAVLGMGIGVISNSVPLYLSEIPPVAIRGSVVGSWQLMLAIGQVIGACVGQGTHALQNTGAYRIPMGINLAFIVILALG
ncbi:general substrate transporter, partial [Schizophyllum fasciatum]